MSNLTAWKLIGWDKSSKMNNTSHTLHPTSTLTSFKVISQFHSSVIIKLLNNEQRMLTPIFILTFHICLFFQIWKTELIWPRRKKSRRLAEQTIIPIQRQRIRTLLLINNKNNNTYDHHFRVQLYSAHRDLYRHPRRPSALCRLLHLPHPSTDRRESGNNQQLYPLLLLHRRLLWE